MDIGIALAGLMVGFLVGLTGVGGAAILTPLLVLIGVPAHTAVGTDLLYNSITKLFGTIQHWRQKTIDLFLVKYLALGSLPGAIIAVVLLKVFDTFFHNQEEIIKHALGFVLIFVALATIWNQFSSKVKENKIKQRPDSEKKGMTVMIGLLLGFIVGLTSIGSGSLFALALLYFYRMRSSQLVGTDIAHAFLLATAAGLMHAGLGNVDYALMFNLLVGSIPGVLFGSTLSAKVPSKPLRTIIAALIFVSGLKLI